MEKIDRFKLIRKIGQGGMAEVYLAEADYNGLKKTVALKKILAPLSKNSHFKDTFRYEAKLSIELNHPNAVQVFEYGQTSDSSHLYMIMEFLDGVDLMKLIKRAAEISKPLPHGIAAYIASEVLKGLDYAHRLRGSDGNPLHLVHRDVSPQNILISYEGAIKVTDFGIAKALDKEEEKGVLRGKFHYMSPEQAHAEEVDARSDIFAVGLILYQMVTGENPYALHKGIKALDAAKNVDIPPPSLKVEVSVDLEKIISKALAPNKEHRYQRAKDMQADLSRYLHALSRIYDSASLYDLLEELFPPAERLPLRMVEESAGEHTENTTGGRSINDSLGYTMETYSGGGQFKESKNLASMVIFVGGSTQAEARIGENKVYAELDNFMSMVQNILAKDRQNRYRFQQLSNNQLLVVRGIPYTGEYDETELLMDAFRIKRDFATYAEEVPEFFLGIGVFRTNVELTHESGNVKWSPSAAGLQETKWLSRVMKNEIIVSSQIYAAAKYNWDLEEYRDDSDIKKYRLLARKDKVDRIRSRTATNLVGVDFELDRLRRTYFRALEHERMEHLVVLGEMGVGKTSLFQAFIEELEDKATIIRAEARPYHSAIPFSMIINFVKDMLRGHYGQAEIDITENLSQYLKGIIDDPAAHQKVIESLKPLLDPESDSTKGANIGPMVGRALEITLREMSRNKPVIALFEDVQWSDEQSKLILHYFVTNEKLKGRVFFLFSGREEDNFPKGFFVKPPLVMGNMDSAMARKFVEGHFVNPESAQNIVNEIVKRGEGNPFFLKELINSTVDLGFCQALDDQGGKLVLTRTGPEQPDLGMSSPTLEGIITSRLDALDNSLRRVLRLAAVFGRSFSKELLDKLINDDSAEPLEALIKRRILRRHGESNKYSFIQQIVRDFAYKGLPDEIKRQAHLEVAKIKLTSPAYHAAHDDPVIAAHFEQGGDRKSAATHYLSAAHHARKLASNTEAERHYQKVLELVSEDKEMVYHAHKDLEVIYHDLGARDGQMRHISQMQTLAEEEGNDQWKAVALCRRMAYYQGIGEPNRTLELFDKVIPLAQRCEDYYCQADAYRILARAKLDLGEIEEALKVADQGMAIVAQRPEISSIMGDLHHIKGNALYYRGKMDQAIETYLKALEMFRDERKRTQESTILMNLGFLSSIIGDYDKAIGYYKKAYDIDLEKGDKINTGIKLSNLAQTHIDLGNYSSAKRLLREARKLCEHTRDTGALSDTTLTLAQLKIRQGEYVEAMRHIQTGIEYALSAKSRIDEIRGLLLWAECQLEDPDGDYQRALDKSSEAISLSEKAKLPDGLIHGLSLKARALLKLTRPEEASQFSAQAVAFSTVSKIQGVDTIYHVHGLVMKALGEHYFSHLFIQKAWDEVQRKVSLMGHDKQKQRYLSVKPAADILRDYKRSEEK